MPMIDHEEHSKIIQCSCEPSLQVAQLGILVVVHNSFIPQIPCAVETAKQILKNKTNE